MYGRGAGDTRGIRIGMTSDGSADAIVLCATLHSDDCVTNDKDLKFRERKQESKKRKKRKRDRKKKKASEAHSCFC